MAASSFSDQMGRTISIECPPQRIISLVPSQTELLAELGLAESVVGITKFCVHPEGWLKRKTIVGGTKKFQFEIIQKLNPDLIIGNKEENYREGIEALSRLYPVWMSDINVLQDALAMISSVGEITSMQQESNKIIGVIRSKFATIKKHNGQTVLYLIWKEPWMSVGSDTFIHHLVTLLGLSNVTGNRNRYPALSENEISLLAPEYIFLSSEPFPFRQQHVEEIQKISPQSKVLLVDGEMFSWYGSRLMKAPDYFNTLQLD
jgi:ABC-type Fe3+-hydroxamate transport system substrate-binding protein